MPIEAARAK